MNTTVPVVVEPVINETPDINDTVNETETPVIVVPEFNLSSCITEHTVTRPADGLRGDNYQFTTNDRTYDFNYDNQGIFHAFVRKAGRIQSYDRGFFNIPLADKP